MKEPSFFICVQDALVYIPKYVGYKSPVRRSVLHMHYDYVMLEKF